MKSGHQRAGKGTATSRRRRAKRGAVMVEALVAIPFFLIIFASTVFIGDLYRTKLRTHQASMAEAWVNAFGDCESGIGLPPLPGTGGIDWDEAAEAPGAALCDKDFAKIQSEKSGNVTASSIIGGNQADATTKTTILCNEVAETGDFEGATDFLWQIFGSEVEEL
jgi:hypothetical protein